jgi:ribosomal protein S17E
MSIREALVKRIGENIGQEYAQDIQNAFEAQTIDEKLMQMV